MALFLFVSGYFSKIASGIKQQGVMILKKIRTQLIPYFALNILFGLITVCLGYYEIHLGSKLNWQSMFITPFGRGDQFRLYLASWFLITLFFINVFAILIYTGHKKVDIGLAIYFAIISLILITKYLRPEDSIFSIYSNFGIRVLLGFLFFSVGRMFRMFEPVLSKFLVKPYMLIVLFLLIDIIRANIGDLTYSILFSDLGQTKGIWVAFAHIISTLSIISITYILGNYFSLLLKNEAFIYKIGRNSFVIMVWHFSMFWIINYIFYIFGFVKFSDLSDVYLKVYPEKTWIIYTTMGILGPMGLGSAFRRIAGCLSRKVLPHTLKTVFLKKL
jgi:fucose 4-O-acetylase-like acetyltransferase